MSQGVNECVSERVHRRHAVEVFPKGLRCSMMFPMPESPSLDETCEGRRR